MHNKSEVLAPRVEGPQSSDTNEVDSSEGLAGVTQSLRVAEKVSSVSNRPRGRGSRSAWFLPKPKPFGPFIPDCMDDAYWNEINDSAGVVYFLGAFPYDDLESLELVKIGFSTNLGARLNNLCSNMGMMKGQLLATAKGGHGREGCYHKHFIEHRWSGEWFHPEPPIVAEINRLRSMAYRSSGKPL